MNSEPINPSKMQVIYPHYINSLKERRMGRRISAKLGVPDPSIEEICNACKTLGITYQAETDHCYPRDHLFEEDKGRVKVLLKKDGKSVLPRIPNKFALYVELCKAITAGRGGKKQGGKKGKNDKDSKGNQNNNNKGAKGGPKPNQRPSKPPANRSGGKKGKGKH